MYVWVLERIRIWELDEVKGRRNGVIEKRVWGKIREGVNGYWRIESKGSWRIILEVENSWWRSRFVVLGLLIKIGRVVREGMMVWGRNDLMRKGIGGVKKVSGEKFDSGSCDCWEERFVFVFYVVGRWFGVF